MLCVCEGHVRLGKHRVSGQAAKEMQKKMFFKRFEKL